MFGNLITNRQLQQLRVTKELTIDPFDRDSLKATHYTLHAGCILRRQADGTWISDHNFSEKKNPCILQKDEYVVVQVKERIKIYSDGIVGRFITTSEHIENGLLITAGQIDHKYGTNGEALRFGVKNLLSEPNSISEKTRLAHVEFFDLRGITIDPVNLTGVEDLIRAIRKVRAEDDGPIHEQ